MFDDKTFRSILKSEGGLYAVKYMKTETGLPLKDCKAYLDKVVAEPISLVGSITWFKCEDQLPPIAHEDYMGKPSEKVLVWGKDGFPIQTYYVHDAKCWFSFNNIPFEITHWAYINEPE